MPTVVLRRCALLAAWASSALRGEVSAERAMDVLADDPPVVFLDAGERRTFLGALGTWRSAGITGWRYVPVAPGDAASLPGPREFAAGALEAGVALVTVGGPPVGLVPTVDADELLCTAHRTEGYGSVPPESASDAERRLLETVTRSIAAFDELDVASWREDVADLLGTWHDQDPVPPEWGERARRLASRSLRVLELTDLAAQDTGGSRTSSETQARAILLRDLAGAARAAHAVAWNDGLRRAGAARPPRGHGRSVP